MSSGGSPRSCPAGAHTFRYRTAKAHRSGFANRLSESNDNDLTYFLLAQVKVIQQAITNLKAYLERKATELWDLQQQLEGSEGLNQRQIALLRHPGFRYSVLSHQSSHGVSHQTTRSDLQKLASRGLVEAMKESRREVFRVPVDLVERL
jgi:Fic family protein